MLIELRDLLNCSGVKKISEEETEPVGLSKLVIKELNIIVLSRFDLIITAYQIQTKRFKEMQRKLFEKYGEKEMVPELNEDETPKLDENENPIMKESGNLIIKNEKLEGYNTELNQLLQEKITIDCEPIPFELFDDVKLNYEDYKMLKPFLAENNNGGPDLKVVK